MATQTFRTTFSLYEGTAARLKRLAERWNISQAEVVRRAVELAEKGDQNGDKDPVAELEAFHQETPLSQQRADEWCGEISKKRKN